HEITHVKLCVAATDVAHPIQKTLSCGIRTDAKRRQAVLRPRRKRPSERIWEKSTDPSRRQACRLTGKVWIEDNRRMIREREVICDGRRDALRHVTDLASRVPEQSRHLQIIHSADVILRHRRGNDRYRERSARHIASDVA